MREFIKYRVRKVLFEQDIDGENMNPALQSLCNTMSINTYDEVIQRVTQAIGSQQENPNLWSKIAEPLKMLSQANNQISGERHTNYYGNPQKATNGMTGDSMVDESDTWWTAIQSALCEQGGAFV